MGESEDFRASKDGTVTLARGELFNTVSFREFAMALIGSFGIGPTITGYVQYRSVHHTKAAR